MEEDRPNKELPNRCTSEQRRIEVQMQVRRLNLLFRPFQRCLVNTHTVREVRLEEVIVPPRNLRNSLSELRLLVGVQIKKSPLVRLAHDHSLERPYSPPGTDDEEGIVLKDNTLLFLAFERGPAEVASFMHGYGMQGSLRHKVMSDFELV